jgi:hypothetical protein
VQQEFFKFIFYQIFNSLREFSPKSRYVRRIFALIGCERDTMKQLPKKDSPERPEPFVSAEEAARFLSISRRYLLTLARGGIAGAYAIGNGRMRKIWVFRLSELAIAVEAQSRLILKPHECVTMRSGSLRAERST